MRKNKSFKLKTLTFLLLLTMVMFSSVAFANNYGNVKVEGISYYGASKLILEEINDIRQNKNEIHPLILDENLQEIAMQLSAEYNFYPSGFLRNQRPNGESSYSISNKIDYIYLDREIIANPTNENIKNAFKNFYLDEYKTLLTNEAYTGIGIGLFKSNVTNNNTIYGVIVLSKDDVNKGSYKTTKEEIRTINLRTDKMILNVDNANLSNQTLKVGQTIALSIYNRNFYGEYLKFPLTETSWTSESSKIATVNAQGVVTAIAPGKTTITGKVLGNVARYTITVEGTLSIPKTETPEVSSLKQLPKTYEGEAIVSGKAIYVKNQKKFTGNVKINGKTYYYKDGVKATGNVKIKGKTYYYKTGVKYTGWRTVKKKTYYYSKGLKVKGWKTISGNKYYFNKKYVMVTGWNKIKSNYYYFDKKTGIMQKNKKIGKYYVNSKGVKTKKK